MQKILTLFLLFSVTVSAQLPNDKIKSGVMNTKTLRHINIPGTKLYIIPPPNFTIATQFIGLIKGDKSMLNVYDLVGGNYYTNAATFNKEAFEAKGGKVLNYQEIELDGYPAKYISLVADPATKSYALVFGDTTFSVMIMAVCPATDDVTGNEIVHSLNTVWYDKNKKINPFEVASFSLNDKISKFKFFKFSANMYLYTLGGVDDTNSKDAPKMIVTQLPKDNMMTAKSIADMLISKVQQYGVANPEIKESSDAKINGYESYETEVAVQMQGRPCLLYYRVVINGDKAVVVQGIAQKDFDSNLQEFKKLASTIHMK